MVKWKRECGGGEGGDGRWSKMRRERDGVMWQLEMWTSDVADESNMTDGRWAKSVVIGVCCAIMMDGRGDWRG